MRLGLSCVVSRTRQSVGKA
ncbi:hypothetical protein Godav_029145 [Gossypium davidsonii]|uniref:Uncharacterized protein n=1 Tax=Gossypium davidsonii TaxID=34287 RepID=A0A7J8TKG0_GOSDV|nr:hypothetical protein [Gossypium davidsonii]